MAGVWTRVLWSYSLALKPLNHEDTTSPFETVTNSSKTIQNIINKTSNTHIKSDTGIYAPQCLICDKKYSSETLRSIQKWIYEHKRDLKKTMV